MLTLHLRQNNATQAFDAAKQARSRVLADLLSGQSAQPHNIPTDLVARREDLRQELDQAYNDEDAAAQIIALERSLADVDCQIELLDPAYAGLEAMNPLTANEVRERLPADSVLLNYVVDADGGFWALVITSDIVEAVPIPRVSERWLRDFLLDHLDGTRQGSLVPEPATGHLRSPRSLFPLLYKSLFNNSFPRSLW